MRGLIFVPKSGQAARFFRLEAARFLACHGLPASDLVEIDVEQDPTVRRAAVVQALRAQAVVQALPLDVVAFCCHGWPHGIQLGFRLASVAELAEALALASVPSVRVPLYCCGTGADTDGTAGDGGFGDALRDALCRAGAVDCWVDGHLHSGHCTAHPYVRRFHGAGSKAGGAGGQMIVERSSTLWARWRERLGEHDPSLLRFRYPLLSVDEIHQELQE